MYIYTEIFFRRTDSHTDVVDSRTLDINSTDGLHMPEAINNLQNTDHGTPLNSPVEDKDASMNVVSDELSELDFDIIAPHLLDLKKKMEIESNEKDSYNEDMFSNTDVSIHLLLLLLHLVHMTWVVLVVICSIRASIQILMLPMSERLTLILLIKPNTYQLIERTAFQTPRSHLYWMISLMIRATERGDELQRKKVIILYSFWSKLILIQLLVISEDKEDQGASVVMHLTKFVISGKPSASLVCASSFSF